jgi:hypothetical protein
MEPRGLGFSLTDASSLQFVSSGRTMVTTITKPATITFVTCPGLSPTKAAPSVAPTVAPTVVPPPKIPSSNATVPIKTGGPVPTSKPGVNPFTGGSAGLGISFGSVIAIAALFGGLLL